MLRREMSHSAPAETVASAAGTTDVLAHVDAPGTLAPHLLPDPRPMASLAASSAGSSASVASRLSFNPENPDDSTGIHGIDHDFPTLFSRSHLWDCLHIE